MSNPDEPSREDEAPPPPPPAVGGEAAQPIPWSDEFLWPGTRSDAPESDQAGRLELLRSVLVASLLIALSVLVWSARPPGSDALPPDVWGRWTGATAPFVDRGLLLSVMELGFDQGGGHLTRYRIRRVVHKRQGTLHRYRIVYLAEGGDAELDLEHDPSARTLRILSRPRVIWRR